MTAYISKQLNTKQKPVLLWALLGIIVFLALLYAYFLNMAVMSVLARESIGQEIAIATSDVSGLEGRYTSLEQSITADKASSLGLVSGVKVSYLTSQDSSLLTFGGSAGGQ